MNNKHKQNIKNKLWTQTSSYIEYVSLSLSYPCSCAVPLSKLSLSFRDLYTFILLKKFLSIIYFIYFLIFISVLLFSELRSQMNPWLILTPSIILLAFLHPLFDLDRDDFRRGPDIVGLFF